MTVFHFHNVNPSVLRVLPHLFRSVAILPDSFPMVKVAIICHAYCIKTEDYEVVGDVCYSGEKGIRKAVLSKLVENPSVLAHVHEFLSHHLKGCQLDGTHASLVKCVCSMLAKVGKVTYNSGNLTVDQLDASKIANTEAPVCARCCGTGCRCRAILDNNQAIKKKGCQPGC